MHFHCILYSIISYLHILAFDNRGRWSQYVSSGFYLCFNHCLTCVLYFLTTAIVYELGRNLIVTKKMKIGTVTSAINNNHCIFIGYYIAAIMQLLWQTCVSAELQSGPIRHNRAKNKLQLKHKNSLFTLQTFHYNYYWWSQSLLYRFGWEMYTFQR
jgi:hypothetical protein